jgi:hypothetical protein
MPWRECHERPHEFSLGALRRGGHGDLYSFQPDRCGSIGFTGKCVIIFDEDAAATLFNILGTWRGGA